MNRLLLALLLCSCTDEAGTIKTLRAHGFTDIQTTGFVPFECGKDDDFATGFRAKNPKGDTVEGTVCCGLWGKGCTVRF
jgi:hypothetical protein